MHHAHRRPPLRWLAAVTALVAAAGASAQITFYEHDGFQGRSFTTRGAVTDFRQRGFNDRASSVVVTGERWEICENARYGGPCTVLRPGQYASLGAMGLNDRVSSVRAVGRKAAVADDRYAPPPVVAGDYRRRQGERLYEAPVTAVRAVYGAPEQRCWVEREQVSGSDDAARVPGALIGAVIGGILGHQVGGGTGRDIATIGGAVAGAVVGSNAGRDRNGGTREVQRCADRPAAGPPAFWDVTYRFRGQEHRVQLTAHPGAAITVNRQGEPRA